MAGDAPRRYKAFISYSHAVDGRLAPAIQAALMRFAKPWWAMRAFRVFRDQTNLSARPSLWNSIAAALDQSEYFILLLSEASARSKWVARELEHWLARNPPATVLLVTTQGRLAWNAESSAIGWQDGTALPSAFSCLFPDEPRYVDLGWAGKADTDLSLDNNRFRDAIADLAAALHDRPKEELIGEEVLQHRKFTRLRNGAVAALALLTAISAALAVNIYRQGIELEKQRDTALRQRQEVLRTLEWAVSQNVVFDFDRASLDGAAANMLKGFVERLRASGFEGTIAIYAYAGRFCLQRNARGELALAPDDMPAARCLFHSGGGAAYAQMLAKRRAESIKRFLVENKVDTSRVHTESRVRTRFPYPDRGKATAGQWNDVARMNNSVAIDLLDVEPR